MTPLNHLPGFEQDTDLLGTLNEFLNGSISGKAMRKWAECINKSIQRRVSAWKSVATLVPGLAM